MMVGPSGSGKSSAWHVLLKSLERLEGVEGVAHVIDPKVSLLIISYKANVTFCFINMRGVKHITKITSISKIFDI